jgi:hypothetical protein
MARKPLTRALRERAKASLRPTSPAQVGFGITELLSKDMVHLVAPRRYFRDTSRAAIVRQVVREYWGFPEDANDLLLFDQAVTIGKMPPVQIELSKMRMAETLDKVINSVIDSGEQLITAAESAEPEQIEDQIKQGAPVNYHDPRNGATALHYIAAQGARPALRVLLKSGELDFLARDDRGRLASTLAGTYGRDLAMERFLLTKAIRQARESGIPLQQIYRRDAASRSARSPGP